MDENKNNLINDLYALRTGLSVISVIADDCKNIDNDKIKSQDELKSANAKRILEEENNEKISNELKTLEMEKRDWSQHYVRQENDRIKGLLMLFFGFLFAIGLIAVLFIDFRLPDWCSEDWFTILFWILWLILAVVAGSMIWGFFYCKPQIFGLKKQYEMTINKIDEKIRKLQTKLDDSTNNIRKYNTDYLNKKTSISKKINVYNDAIILNQKCANITYNQLVDQFSQLLSPSDWNNLDLIIYYLSTNRADSVKEALQLLDRQTQTNSIINEMRNAIGSLAMEISSLKIELKETIAKCAIVLSNQIFSATKEIRNAIESSQNSIVDQLGNISSNLNEISNQNIYQKALLEKQNQTSQELLNDYKYINNITI